MSRGPNAAAEYRAAARLLTEAAQGVTRTVQRMHRAIARRPFGAFGVAAQPAKQWHDSISELVYSSVLAGLTVGGALTETAAHAVGSLRPSGSLVDSPAGGAAAGVLNGAFGERGYTAPPVMSLRVDGAAVPVDRASLTEAYPDAAGHIVLFLHGLIETERWWYPRAPREGRPARVDFGTRLATDLACTPLYVRYHSGRHISGNGRELDELMSALVAEWPTKVERISIIGHSLGGLVARSAVHTGAVDQSPWLSELAHVVCLGSPHTGAPLEFGAHLVSWTLRRFPESAPLGDLLELRSEGIKDLRYGYLHEEQWADRDPDVLLGRVKGIKAVVSPGVRQHFLSVTISRNRNGMLARFFGDALVTPTSSADESQEALRHWLGGMHHFDLLRHDEVYRQLLAWLRTSD